MTRPGMLLALATLAGCPHAGPTPPSDSDPANPVGSVAGADPAALLARGRASERDELRASAWSADPVPDARLAGLDDPSAYVQAAVVRALGTPLSPAADAVLEGIAANPDRDPLVRSLAAVAAGAEAVKTAWRSESAPERVMPLAYAAMRLGDADARRALEAALAAGELPYDPALLAFLSQDADPGLAAALAKGAPNVEEEMAITVAATRLRLGDGGGEALLREQLGNEEEAIRAEVLDALVDVTHPAAAQLLERAHRDHTGFVSDYAGLVLASRGAADDGVYARALEGTDWELRVLAVRFAGRAMAAAPGDRALGKVLSAGLADESAPVRAEAARAVGRAGYRDAAPTLRLLLGDDALPVAVAAAVALVELGA